MKQAPARGWPLRLIALLEQPSSSISTPVSVLAIVLFIALVVIGLLSIGWLLADLLCGDQKRATDAAKAALPILAGAIGLPLIIWRLIILDRQTRISETKAEIDRETHYTSIFSRAIEQLGQTRELKRVVLTEDGSNDTTATVPNIEVRLGGIHSLSRLAEESVRDREKIENLLRSYIRENSWSDRLGQTYERLAWPRRSNGWAFGISENYNSDEAKSDIGTWIAEVDTRIDRATNWAEDLPETRVDVNEATDALAAQATRDTSEPNPTLYECLFVGRHFNHKFLTSIYFRRCTFVRCTFDIEGIEHGSMLDSTIVDCTFSGSPAGLAIQHSVLGDTRFRECDGAVIDLADCDTYRVRFNGCPSKLSLESSSLYRASIGYPRDEEKDLPDIILDLSGAVLLKTRLRGMKLSADSNLQVLANPDTEISNLNMEDVLRYYDGDLAGLKADQKSVHPKIADRPATWPPLRLSDNDIDNELTF